MRQLASNDVELLESNKQLTVYGGKKGFVIVNNYDKDKPVIGYSATKYNKENLPEGLRWWMKMAENAIQKQNGMTEHTTKRAGITKIDPFITTTWDQEKPYYYCCPKSEGEFCYTGCVATTLAQSLYYYKYPASVKGHGTYTIGEKKYEKDFNTTYDWKNMKDSYKETALRLSDSVQAVATLMRDCGYATNMSYSVKGSGTSDFYIPLALKDVFKYDSLAIRYYDHLFYSDEEWKDMVYASLMKKIPVMYAGADEAGESAHEFLLCGIDKEGLVYVNWGWGGSGDGFYDLDMLKYFGNDFNHYQSMVTGIKAQETPDASDVFESMWISDAINYVVQDEDILQMTLSYLYNYAILDFNGTIDLTLVNKSNASDITYIPLLDTDEDNLGGIQPFYGFFFVDDETEEVSPIYVDGFKDLSPGIYRMYLTSKEVRDKKRQVVRGPIGGVQYATLKKLTNGQLLVSNEDVDDINTDVSTMKALHQDIISYNLQGQEVNGSTKGLLIRKQGNNMKKVMMK